MEITLEKIDILRARADITYEQAANYLKFSDGDLVQALIAVERDNKERQQSALNKSNQMLERIKDIIKKGNAKKIIIRQDAKVIAEIPVTAGVLGGLIAPQLAVIGAITALATNCSIEIESKDNETISANVGMDAPTRMDEAPLETM